MSSTGKRPYKVIGTRPIRHDGVDRVTGRAQYAADYAMPDMLWGRILRSPHAHAKSLRIDASAALALPTGTPGIKKDIEFVDEATPLSYERYTGNWLGSTCGWLMTRETMPMLIMGIPKTRRAWEISTWPDSGWSRVAASLGLPPPGRLPYS